MSRLEHLKKAIIGASEQPKPFMLDPQKHLGHYVEAGKLLQRILQGKSKINDVHAYLEYHVDWVLRYGSEPQHYQNMLTHLRLATTYTHHLVHQYVLPFYQPEKRGDKETKVRGYVKQYNLTKNETLLVLEDLKRETNLTKQRVMTFQRIMDHNSVYQTLVDYLNGITPDREFVIPTIDNVYVLPQGMMQGNQPRSITPAEFLIRKEAPPSREAFAERLTEAI